MYVANKKDTYRLIDMRRTLFIEYSEQNHSNAMFCAVKKKTYLVCLTFSPNGSNETEIRFTAFKFIRRTFLAMAANMPPERLREPVVGIDMVKLFSGNFFYFKTYLL